VDERAHLTKRESLRAGTGRGVAPAFLFLLAPLALTTAAGNAFGAANSSWVEFGGLLVGVGLWLWRIFAIGVGIEGESLVITNLLRSHRIAVGQIVAIKETSFWAMGWGVDPLDTPGYAIIMKKSDGEEQTIKVVATLSSRDDATGKQFLDDQRSRYGWEKRRRRSD